MSFSRRHVLQGLGASLLLPRLGFATEAPDLSAALAALEATSGGRLGVQLLDATGEVVMAHRATERFAMCSTVKALVTGAVLAEVDAGRVSLSTEVRVRKKDLVAYSPVTEGRTGSAMSLDELCHAAMTVSDNTALNLIFSVIGGVEAVNTVLRRLGDETSRLDRDEPSLNDVDLAHGDVRDTTTPAAAAQTVRAFVFGDALTDTSRERYRGWLRASKTGGARLRATWPEGWLAGDKTGTGVDGPTNDIAVAWPPDRAPFVLAAFYDRAGKTKAENEAVLAAVGELVLR